MSVISLIYTDPKHKNVKTVYDSDIESFGPYPSNDGPTREAQEQFMKSGGTILPYILPPEPVPQQITRRQCAIELRERSLITPQEALDMTKYGDVPALVAQVFATMTDADRIIAETDFAADTYERTNPLLIQVMTSTGASEEDIDDFFRDASIR